MAAGKNRGKPFSRSRRIEPQRVVVVDADGNWLATVTLASRGRGVTVTPAPDVEVIVEPKVVDAKPAVS